MIGDSEGNTENGRAASHGYESSSVEPIVSRASAVPRRARAGRHACGTPGTPTGLGHHSAPRRRPAGAATTYRQEGQHQDGRRARPLRPLRKTPCRTRQIPDTARHDQVKRARGEREWDHRDVNKRQREHRCRRLQASSPGKHRPGASTAGIDTAGSTCANSTA